MATLDQDIDPIGHDRLRELHELMYSQRVGHVTDLIKAEVDTFTAAIDGDVLEDGFDVRRAAEALREVLLE